MAKVTMTKILAEFTQDEVRVIRFALKECLNDWDFTDGDDRRTAEELMEDLGDYSE
jgi:hypothetical protein